MVTAQQPPSPPLLEVEELVVGFRVAGGRTVRAVDGVSFALRPGETLGLVGESGCGKTTLGRAVLRLIGATSGAVRFGGVDVARGRAADAARLRREAAMVFQDPYASLNPRLTIGEAVAEVLRVHRKVPRARVAGRVAELLALVGLAPELARSRPRALSGGQCQRAGIARALAVEPRLIVADECVAALDVSIQAQVINLLIELRERMGLAIVFIAHDLAVVRRLCDRVAVMYLGRIVEEGPTERVFGDPQHPYTAALVRAIPRLDPDAGPLAPDPLPGEPASPLRMPEGCPFHPRCPEALPACRGGEPPALLPAHGRLVACLLRREPPAPTATVQPALPARENA